MYQALLKKINVELLKRTVKFTLAKRGEECLLKEAYDLAAAAIRESVAA